MRAKIDLILTCMIVAYMGGACAARNRLSIPNLPDTLPECSSLYHWKGFPLLRNGSYGDRAIICLQKADGTFAWFETPFKEVK